jgi:diadenylate cyclase
MKPKKNEKEIENEAISKKELEKQGKIKKTEEKKRKLIETLKLFSPGTSLRNALDWILHAGMGAFIVIDNEEISNVSEGGFRVNCKFSSQKLVELAKMDGGIILLDDLKKIKSANVLFVPRSDIFTSETGTRHKAAERVAKQTGAVTIAVSERRRKITIYFGDESYTLESSSEIMRRASESLQVLEKQKEIYLDSLNNVNLLEITDFASVSDICSLLQRIEIIRRISGRIKRYLIELGKEGDLISLRLKELIRGVDSEKDALLKDYFPSKSESIMNSLDRMDLDFLLNVSNLFRILFEELHDREIYPRGFRILRKTTLLDKDMELLLGKFKTLGEIFDVDEEKLTKIFESSRKSESIKKVLADLKEKIIMGKKI